MAERVGAGGGALRALSAKRIVGFVADAAERWSDADFAPRVRAGAAIEARLGYTTPVVDYALDRLFFGITRDALEAAIASELGSLAALDGITDRAGAPAAWARGVDRVAIVSSDTTIGVALVPAVFALCAKCDVVVKDREDALIAAFFASLAEEHPAFASAAQARAWTGAAAAVDTVEDDVLASADVVVAFGRDETLREIRARCASGARFVPFGHRVSVGRLTRADVAALNETAPHDVLQAADPRGALHAAVPHGTPAPGTPAPGARDGTLAERIARDALLYDGEGCLSLHALFVEAEGDALVRTAETLAAAFDRVAVEFPGGTRSPQSIAEVASYRNLAAFRAAGGRGAIFRAADATLVVAPPFDDPPPLLPRVLPIIGTATGDAVRTDTRPQRGDAVSGDEATSGDGAVCGDDAGGGRADEAVVAYCAAQRLPVQALGVVAADARAVALAARIGAVRVAPFGTMQAPPLGGHHGGEPRIADFVRWIDRE